MKRSVFAKRYRATSTYVQADIGPIFAAKQFQVWKDLHAVASHKICVIGITMTNPYHAPKAGTEMTTSLVHSPRSIRWVYVSMVLLVGFSVAFNPSTASELRLAITGQLLMLFTYPFGIIGSLCAFALIYSGIATPGEAYIMSTPIFAVVGYLQWNLLVPHLVDRRVRQLSLGGEGP